MSGDELVCTFVCNAASYQYHGIDIIECLIIIMDKESGRDSQTEH